MIVEHKEKKRVKFRVSFLFLFLIASFLGCFALYMNEARNDMENFEPVNAVLRQDDESGGTEASPAERTVINPVPSGPSAGDGYFNGAVFIGGEVLEGLCENNIVKEKNVFSDDMMTASYLTALSETGAGGYGFIIDFIAEASPESAYLLFNPNKDADISGDICSGMSKLIDEIKKSAGETKIYIISVLPVTSSGEEVYPRNSEIDKFNSLALSLANEKNIYYLDINTELKGMDGKLSSGMTEADGISLKKETYEIIAEYILTHTAGSG